MREPEVGRQVPQARICDLHAWCKDMSHPAALGIAIKQLQTPLPDMQERMENRGLKSMHPLHVVLWDTQVASVLAGVLYPVVYPNKTGVL